MPRRPVTLAHVALMAGVSRTTVSNVLTGSGRTSPHTAERVRQAAEKLGYRYHGGAGALRTGGSPVVGFIVDIDSAALASSTPALWWPRTLFTCMDVLADRGYVGVVLPMNQPDAAAGVHLDALVTVERAGGRDVLPRGLGFGIPVFYGGFSDIAGDVPRVAPDYPAIVRDVFNHLISRGAQRPALAGLSHPLSVADHLENAYRDWCTDAGVTPIVTGRDSETLGAQIATVLSDGGDAVYSLDIHTHTILGAFQTTGAQVGRDVLLAVQSEGVIEAHLCPTVTTMSLCGRRTGELLAEALISAVEGGTTASVTVPHELTARESTLGPNQFDPHGT